MGVQNRSNLFSMWTFVKWVQGFLRQMKECVFFSFVRVVASSVSLKYSAASSQCALALESMPVSCDLSWALCRSG